MERDIKEQEKQKRHSRTGAEKVYGMGYKRTRRREETQHTNTEKERSAATEKRVRK